MNHLIIRCFSSSSRQLARQKRSAFVPSPIGDISNLTGNPSKDGFDRYQIEFLETAMWSKEMLEAMRDDVEELSQQYKPYKPKKSPITLKTTTVYEYDFTIPDPDPRNVAVGLEMKITPQFWTEAGLIDAKQQQKFLILCGTMYDPITSTVSLDCDRFEYRAQNIKWLSDVVDKFIQESKDVSDFDSLPPLDLTHVKPSQPNLLPLSLENPRDWLAPMKSKPQQIQRHRRPNFGDTEKYGKVDVEFEEFSRNFPKEWIKK